MSLPGGASRDFSFRLGDLPDLMMALFTTRGGSRLLNSLVANIKGVVTL